MEPSLQLPSPEAATNAPLSTPGEMRLPAGKFCVGEFEVVPRRLEISHHGQVIQIEPKVMGVFVDLVQSAGVPRTKREILQSVWPDVVVGDAVLSRAISILRHTLGEDAKHPCYIQTIPRVGYRFVGEVSYQAGEVTEAVVVVEEKHLNWRLLTLIGVLLLLAFVLGLLVSR